MNPNALAFRPRLVQTDTVEDSRSRVNCKYLQRGACRYGQACAYLHRKDAVQAKQAASSTPVEDSPPQGAEETMTRTISGTLAHFAAGASITKLLFTSDLSAVQLTGLPPDSTQESVFALLVSQRIDTSKISPFRVLAGGSFSSARVEAEDARFADSVVAKLGRRVMPGQAPGINAVPIAVETFSASGSSALRVDSKKVQCSWHRATKAAWLSFPNPTVTKRVQGRFSEGKDKILNQTVQAGEPVRGTNRWRENYWTVRLSNLSSETTESDIRRPIGARGDGPRSIEIGTPTYRMDAETSAAEVLSLFTAIGPLEWWELTQDATGKRVKASGRFIKEEDAKRATATLHDTPLPFQPTAKLTVQLVYSARFKVSSLIFDAVQRDILNNIWKWKTKHIYFTAHEQSQPPKWYRALKLEGEDSKSVAEAKQTISDILSGRVAREGSATLWHPSLRGNGPIFDRLMELQRETGVVILRSKAKSQLRLFGPPKKCEEVEKAIAEMLRSQSLENFVVLLNED